MNQEEIKKLLDRYFEGETSLEEERQLKAYFKSNEVPEALRSEQSLFAFFSREKQQKMPIKKARIFPKYALIAASLLFLIGVGSYFLSQNTNDLKPVLVEAKYNQDTYDNPEQAAIEIQAALNLVSRKMRKSRKIAKKGLQKTAVIGKIFKKQ